ncbi:MAG: cytochrome c biogenesis protein CcsA [Chloroflexi bacterium]|nr:cytochrome c biogenesis protein CcsA [Chloroflexota bacterium]
MKPQTIALKALNIVSVLLFLASLSMVFLYAPLEVTMNYVQKIFYFHIATAWVGMLGFIAAAVAGVVYLIKHDQKWDIVELAAVEISLVFFFIAIAAGSIWARPSWGTYWTWEPRLTTAAILEMVYLAYLLLRQGIDDPDRRARFSAVYTLVGAISVPITFMSIRLFRTIHPVVIGTNSATSQGSFDMTSIMLATMFFVLFAFSVIFVNLFWHRIRLGQLAQQVEQLKLEELK